MGLSNERTGGTVVYVSKGKFLVKTSDGYCEYTFLRGTLVGLHFDDKKGHEGKVFRQMLMTFSDGSNGDTFHLSLDSSNGYSRAIKAKLASVESFDQPLEISLTYDAETKAAGAFLNQSGHSFRQFWTKDHRPDGMPDVKSLGMVKGKQVFDFSEMESWIESYLLKNVVPKLPAPCQVATTDHSGFDDSQEEHHAEEAPAARNEDAPF